MPKSLSKAAERILSSTRRKISLAHKHDELPGDMMPGRVDAALELEGFELGTPSRDINVYQKGMGQIDKLENDIRVAETKLGSAKTPSQAKAASSEMERLRGRLDRINANKEFYWTKPKGHSSKPPGQDVGNKPGQLRAPESRAMQNFPETFRMDDIKKINTARDTIPKREYPMFKEPGDALKGPKGEGKVTIETTPAVSGATSRVWLAERISSAPGRENIHPVDVVPDRNPTVSQIHNKDGTDYSLMRTQNFESARIPRNVETYSDEMYLNEQAGMFKNPERGTRAAEPPQVARYRSTIRREGLEPDDFYYREKNPSWQAAGEVSYAKGLQASVMRSFDDINYELEKDAAFHTQEDLAVARSKGHVHTAESERIALKQGARGTDLDSQAKDFGISGSELEARAASRNRQAESSGGRDLFSQYLEDAIPAARYKAREATSKVHMPYLTGDVRDITHNPGVFQPIRYDQTMDVRHKGLISWAVDQAINVMAVRAAVAEYPKAAKILPRQDESGKVHIEKGSVFDEVRSSLDAEIGAETEALAKAYGGTPAFSHLDRDRLRAAFVGPVIHRKWNEIAYGQALERLGGVKSERSDAAGVKRLNKALNNPDTRFMTPDQIDEVRYGVNMESVYKSARNIKEGFAHPETMGDPDAVVRAELEGKTLGHKIKTLRVLHMGFDRNRRIQQRDFSGDYPKHDAGYDASLDPFGKGRRFLEISDEQVEELHVKDKEFFNDKMNSITDKDWDLMNVAASYHARRADLADIDRTQALAQRLGDVGLGHYIDEINAVPGIKKSREHIHNIRAIASQGTPEKLRENFSSSFIMLSGAPRASQRPKGWDEWDYGRKVKYAAENMIAGFRGMVENPRKLQREVGLAARGPDWIPEYTGRGSHARPEHPLGSEELQHAGTPRKEDPFVGDRVSAADAQALTRVMHRTGLISGPQDDIPETLRSIGAHEAAEFMEGMRDKASATEFRETTTFYTDSDKRGYFPHEVRRQGSDESLQPDEDTADIEGGTGRQMVAEGGDALKRLIGKDRPGKRFNRSFMKESALESYDPLISSVPAVSDFNKLDDQFMDFLTKDMESIYDTGNAPGFFGAGDAGKVREMLRKVGARTQGDFRSSQFGTSDQLFNNPKMRQAMRLYVGNRIGMFMDHYTHRTSVDVLGAGLNAARRGDSIPLSVQTYINSTVTHNPGFVNPFKRKGKKC